MEPAWTEGRIGSEASSFIPSKEPVASLLGVTGVETTGTLTSEWGCTERLLEKTRVHCLFVLDVGLSGAVSIALAFR